jgi:hypothetical protein
MPEWDSNDLAEHFDGVSTVEMLRVARTTVNELNAYRWIATYPGRTWSYANGWWTSEGGEDDREPQCWDEDMFRYMLGEQLINEGVTRQSPVWQRY